MGAAAVDLCSVACGRLDAFYERGLHAWDVTAGRATELRGGLDIHFDCWAILSEYIYRYGQDNEFRISINLLGVGQAATAAKGLGF